MASVMVTVALVLGAAGCGAGDAPDDEIRAVVGSVDAAFARGDYGGVCERMTSRAKRLLNTIGHFQPPIRCREELARLRSWTSPASLETEAPDVVAVRVDGREATATVRRDGSRPYSVRLTESRHGWQLDGIFDAGASPTFQGTSGVRPDGGPPPPPVSSAGAPVKAAFSEYESRSPCPAVRRRAKRRPKTACALRVEHERLQVTVRGLFGDVPLASCDLNLTLNVDADGTTFTDDFKVDTARLNCGDVEACGYKPKVSRQDPWVGQIERTAAGLRQRFESVCFNTCMGVYRGDLVLGLERFGGGWLLRADDAMVGSSGLVLDGTMEVPPAPVSLSRDPQAEPAA
jgi:hypothetical protein